MIKFRTSCRPTGAVRTRTWIVDPGPPDGRFPSPGLAPRLLSTASRTPAKPGADFCFSSLRGRSQATASRSAEGPGADASFRPGRPAGWAYAFNGKHRPAPARSARIRGRREVPAPNRRRVAVECPAGSSLTAGLMPPLHAANAERSGGVARGDRERVAPAPESLPDGAAVGVAGLRPRPLHRSRGPAVASGVVANRVHDLCITPNAVVATLQARGMQRGCP